MSTQRKFFTWFLVFIAGFTFLLSAQKAQASTSWVQIFARSPYAEGWADYYGFAGIYRHDSSRIWGTWPNGNTTAFSDSSNDWSEFKYDYTWWQKTGQEPHAYGTLHFDTSTGNLIGLDEYGRVWVRAGVNGDWAIQSTRALRACESGNAVAIENTNEDRDPFYGAKSASDNIDSGQLWIVTSETVGNEHRLRRWDASAECWRTYNDQYGPLSGMIVNINSLHELAAIRANGDIYRWANNRTDWQWWGWCGHATALSGDMFVSGNVLYSFHGSSHCYQLDAQAPVHPHGFRLERGELRAAELRTDLLSVGLIRC